jgi:hypothetical protein
MFSLAFLSTLSDECSDADQPPKAKKHMSAEWKICLLATLPPEIPTPDMGPHNYTGQSRPEQYNRARLRDSCSGKEGRRKECTFIGCTQIRIGVRNIS